VLVLGHVDEISHVQTSGLLLWCAVIVGNGARWDKEASCYLEKEPSSRSFSFRSSRSPLIWWQYIL
jgi:hypothetical protein